MRKKCRKKIIQLFVNQPFTLSSVFRSFCWPLSLKDSPRHVSPREFNYILPTFRPEERRDSRFFFSTALSYAELSHKVRHFPQRLLGENVALYSPELPQPLRSRTALAVENAGVAASPPWSEHRLHRTELRIRKAGRDTIDSPRGPARISPHHFL